MAVSRVANGRPIRLMYRRVQRVQGLEAGVVRPQFCLAAGGVKVACVAVGGAGPVPRPGKIERDDAVHLGELAGKLASQRERIVLPGAVEHRAGTVTGHAQHGSWRQRCRRVSSESRTASLIRLNAMIVVIKMTAGG
jgi:hypothetical protein